ncbi:MAG: DnaB-like helicase C-terminal domain-containing protein [Campylobacterota bacterium]|nr:DnaB-like helicase C-terminal domain-containing protein [Campylobacterota bacterium]
MLDSKTHNLYAENILNFIISANEYNLNLDSIMTMGISKVWFENDTYSNMYEILSKMYNENTKYTIDNTLEKFKEYGLSVNESVFWNIVSKTIIVEEMLIEYINDFKKDYQRRQLNQLSLEIRKKVSDPSLSPETIVSFLESSLNDNDFLENRDYGMSLSDVGKWKKNLPKAIRIKTHIPFIDTVFTDNKGAVGIRNQGLMYISGDPESGKTFIATRMVENISREHPVLFGSLEFGKDVYHDSYEEAVEKGYWNGNAENIYTFDDYYNIETICSGIRYFHKEKGIKIAVIDSMMRMVNLDTNLKTDENRISAIFSKLAKLSKELRIPIVVIVQTSKEDDKSSVISVMKSKNASHEAFTWFHLYLTNKKDKESELRTVVWNKNKDTLKHPLQHLMFVPSTADFYRVELDKNKQVTKALDKYRVPKDEVVVPQHGIQPEIINYVSDDEYINSNIEFVDDF